MIGKETAMNEKIVNWIDNVLDTEIPKTVVAFCFNLYEESDEYTWAMELIGAERFDSEDEDWPCYEVTDFNSREHLYRWKMECEWDEALDHMVNELKQYLENGKYAELLKSKDGVGVGFVDGDIEILYSKV